MRMEEKFTVLQRLAEMKRQRMEYHQQFLTTSQDTEQDTCKISSDPIVQVPYDTNYSKAIHTVEDNDIKRIENPNKNIKRKFLKKGEGKLAFIAKKPLPNSTSNNSSQNRTSVSDKKTYNHSTCPVKRNLETGVKNKIELESGHAVVSKKMYNKNYSAASSCNTLYYSSSESCDEFVEHVKNLSKCSSPDDKLNENEDDYPQYSCDDDTPFWAGNNTIERSYINKIEAAEKRNQKEAKELEMFEMLEEKLNSVSFCSTTSSTLVNRLMEPSIKSTPVKVDEMVKRIDKKGSSEYKIEFSCDCGVDEDLIKYDDDDDVKSSGFPNQLRQEKKKAESDGKFNDHTKWEESDCTDLADETSSQANSLLQINVIKDSERTLVNSECLKMHPPKDKKALVYNTWNKDTGIQVDEIKESVTELLAHVDVLKKELKELVLKKEKYASEIKQFEREKQKIMKAFEEQKKEFEIFQEEERKKLLKQKAIVEKHSKSLRDQPKFIQQAQEIKLLKQELSSLQEEMREKQKSYGVSTSSLRVQLHALIEKNHYLTETNESLVKQLNSLKNQCKPGTKRKEIYALKKNKTTSALENINSLVDATCSLSEIQQPVQLVTQPSENKKLSVPYQVSKILPEENSDSDEYPNEEKMFDYDLLKEIGANKNKAPGKQDFNSFGLDQPLPHFQRLSLGKQQKDLTRVLKNVSNSIVPDVDLIKNCPIRQITSSDGIKNISDGNITHLSYSDQRQEWRFKAGETVYRNGHNALVLYPNGEVEITDGHLAVHYFYDGSFKTIHEDGSTETVYPNNRIRIRNCKGELIFDTDQQ